MTHATAYQRMAIGAGAALGNAASHVLGVAR